MEAVKQKQDEILAARRERVIQFLRTREILKDGATEWIVTWNKGKENESQENFVDLLCDLLSEKDNMPFMDLMAMVRQFHDVNNIPLEDMPMVIDVREGAVRFNLMYEEMNETQSATRSEDLIEIYDGLVDQMYILMGTIMKYGFHDVFLAGFQAVQDSNMTKPPAAGTPIYRNTEGKVMKGPFYKPPTDELKEIIANHFQSKREG